MKEKESLHLILRHLLETEECLYIVSILFDLTKTKTNFLLYPLRENQYVFIKRNN